MKRYGLWISSVYKTISVGLVLFPVVSCYECRVKDGIEANLEDEGCETYWLCRHFVGVSLNKCPDGGQVDFQENRCRDNGAVWCQLQHQKLEENRHSDTQHQGKAISQRTRHVSQDMMANNYYYEDNGNSYTNGEGRRHDNFYHDLDQWTYVCESEWGHEPNLKDHRCQSYWRCDHYKGSLTQCKPGLVYDYKAKACLHYRHVGCQEQRHSHMTSHPKHRVEVKTNPDGSKTLIHHYYYEK